MIAQRVSAGFSPPMKTEPRKGRQKPSAQERQHRLASPSLDKPRNKNRTGCKAPKPPRAPAPNWLHHGRARWITRAGRCDPQTREEPSPATLPLSQNPQGANRQCRLPNRTLLPQKEKGRAKKPTSQPRSLFASLFVPCGNPTSNLKLKSSNFPPSVLPCGLVLVDRQFELIAAQLD